MKTLMITTIALLGLSISTFAQKEERIKNREELKAQKVAFITERLALTPTESKAFWPVYDQKDQEKKAIMKSIKGDRKENPKKKMEDMTDDEVKALLNKMIEKKQAELDIQKKYNEKFLAILPAKKVAKLYHVEREFRKQKKEEHHPKKTK